jgi:hypothetical protein
VPYHSLKYCSTIPPLAFVEVFPLFVYNVLLASMPTILMFVGQEPVVQTGALLRGVEDGSVRGGLCARGRLCEAAETIEYYVRV